jgi:phage terminase large subunit-like protein
VLSWCTLSRVSESGKLLYSEWLYSCPKKSGKTTFAALCTLTLLLLFGGQFAEGTLAANDQEQAQGRVFKACRRIILLKGCSGVTRPRTSFSDMRRTQNEVSLRAFSLPVLIR